MDSGSGRSGHAPQDADPPRAGDATDRPAGERGRPADERGRRDSRGLLEQLSRHDAARYELGDELGQGASGVVRVARDGLLRRTVALKLLRTPLEPASGSGAVDRLVRFVEEAQVTGQLDHPGIVPVHDLGLDAEGQVYFTMREVRGQEFRRVIEAVHRGDDEWPLPRALAVVLKICDAMAYAHDKGVVHRDLKPANVMVGRFGEVYVMDWGLARVDGRAETRGSDDAAGDADSVRTDRGDERERSHASSLLTEDGAVVGTPAYMPPEQALGRADALGPWSDVYAVGAMLYHLLSGGAPYVVRGERLTARRLVERVVVGPPEPLEQRAADVPAPLAAITAKAMAREPGERYAHMGELRADLQAYLEGRVVRAHRTGAAAELGSWVRRNAGTAAALSVLVLVLLGGAGALAWVQSVAADEQRLLADDLALERGAALRARDAEAAARRDAESLRDQAQSERERAEALALEAGQRRQEAESATALARQEALAAERQRRSAERVADLMGQLFQAARPGEGGEREPTVREVLDQGAREVALLGTDEPVVKGRLLRTLGVSYRALGQWERADDLCRQAVVLLEVALGPDDPDTLRAQLEHAEVLMVSGQEELANGRLEQLLQHSRRVLGDAHATTQTAVHLAGVSLTRLGLWSEAEALLQEAVDSRGAGGQAWDDAGLAVLAELANLQLARGRPDLAAPLFEQCLEASREVLGRFDVDVLNCSNSLAVIAYGDGRLSEARSRFEDCLEVAERLYDPAHPRLLSLRNNLGAVLLGLQRHDEAALLLQEVLLRRREVLGAGHPETLQSLGNLAALESQRGRQAQALVLYQEALSAMEASLGPRHPETLVVLDNVVKLLGNQRRWEQAEAACAELVARTEASDGRLAERQQLLADLRRQLEHLRNLQP